MHIDQAVSFLDLIIKQTKNSAISWSPLKVPLAIESFPKLTVSHAYYCELPTATLAIGFLHDPYIRSTDFDLFVRLNNSRTYSLFENTDLGDSQDFDLICSKILRLHGLIDSPDSSLAAFVNDYLKDNQ